MTTVSPAGTNGLLSEVTVMRDSITVFEPSNSVLTVLRRYEKEAAQDDPSLDCHDEHQCILKDREEVAERTIAFHFEKPPDFQFKARQFVDAELTEPPEMDSAVRALPIASAPKASFWLLH